MNGVLDFFYGFLVGVNHETSNKDIRSDQHDAERFDMPEGRIHIFEVCEHNVDG
jgi:hypothetical protein